jgi:cytochrome c553
MAFISEYTSQDDNNTFKLDELLNKHLDATASYEHHWVVDKDAGNWLLPIKTLNNSESLWIFHYKDTNIKIKLYKTKGGWDLTSIAPSSLNNQEIIHSLRKALEVLDTNNVTYSKAKEISVPENKKETLKDLKQKSKRKITYLDIFTTVTILGILFFIANDRNTISLSFENNDNNTSTNNTIDENIRTTSTNIQKRKATYNVCAVKHDGIFLLDSENLNKQTKVVDLHAQLIACDVDKYGDLYWVDRTNEGLYKANINGTNRRKIMTLPDLASGLAIDNERERVFSAQWNLKRKHHEIVYSDLSGNNKTILVSDRELLRSVSGMFYDSMYDKLYVADATAKQVVVIDIKTRMLKKLASSSYPSGVVIDYKNNKVIWLDRREKNIYSANLDGSGKKTLIDFNVADNRVNPTYNEAVTIDTINNRLIFRYDLQEGARNQYIVETANLDGSQRIKTNFTNATFNSFSFFNNELISSQTVPNTITKILKKCVACHGKDWSKSALGKSKIVKDMSQEDIAIALKGYKNGTYGGQMKGLMKGQVARYSDSELEAMAEAIKSQ